MRVLKKLISENIRQYGMFLALIIIVVYFNFATNGVSLRPLNVNNIILQNAHVIILAVGMLIVILTGNIDLSVGSVAAFVGAIAGILMVRNDVPWQLALVISLIIGILAGAWNGFWIAYIKIPAFIVTLGGMLIFRGLTLASLEGVTLGPLPDGFNRLSSGFLPDIVQNSSLHVLTLLVGLIFSVGYVISTFMARRKKLRYDFEVSPLWVTILGLIIVIIAINLFTFTLARHRGFPNVSVILLITIVIYAFITRKTTLGRHVYALGGNAEAAKLSGINTRRTMFLVYTNMGFLAALSGVVYAARLNAATPKAGELFELDAIASAFIGGASASGGVGTVIGAVIGALVMGVINNGMSLLGLGIDWQQVVKGLVLLLAVWFDIATKNRVK
ncbi:MAG: multiple monosaccharide ABC transporter permease [Candidatus Izemoplasmataceae bacterium]